MSPTAVSTTAEALYVVDDELLNTRRDVCRDTSWLVRPCETATDTQQWDAYVTRHPQATSDHLWGWRRVLTEAFGYTPHYLGAFAADQLVGVLPLFRVPRGWGRTALSSIPFGNYGGICADSSAVAQALLEAAKALLHAQGGVYLDLRHRTPLAEASLQSRCVHSRFEYPLTGDPDTDWQRWGQNNRKKVSRARRAGLRVDAVNDVDALYRVHLHTTRRLGSPCFPEVYFRAIQHAFGDRVQMLGVELHGALIAYHVLLEFRHQWVAQLGGALAEHHRLFPNNLLIWTLIEHGYRQGIHSLDFCRNRRASGSAAFKRGLRMMESPLVYQYYIPSGGALPERHPGNPRYQRAIQLWQHMPLPLTRWVGPRLVRYVA